MNKLNIFMLISLIGLILFGFFFNFIQQPRFSEEIAVPSQNLNQVVSMFISDRALSLFSVWDMYSPHKANLSITGISLKENSFNVSFNLFFDSNLQNSWIISNLNYTGLSGNVTPLNFINDNRDNYNNALIRKFDINSTNNESFLMIWIINGSSTVDVWPVLTPTFSTLPFRGNKFGKVFKIGDNSTMNPLAEPYNQSSLNDLISNMSFILDYFSNNKFHLDYEIQELYYTGSSQFIQKGCSGVQNYQWDLMKYFLDSANLGTYKKDYFWYIWTGYNSMMYQINCSLLNFHGLAPNPACPYCAGGAWMAYRGDTEELTAMFNRISPNYVRIYLHEFGHGVGLSHRFTNSCRNNSRIFYQEDFSSGCSNDANYIVGMSGVEENIMGQASDVVIHPVQRASLGWLDGSQVRISFKSGIYTLYGDSYYSDTKKPILIQVPVKMFNQSNFLYLTLPRLNITQWGIQSLTNFNSQGMAIDSNSNSREIIRVSSNRNSTDTFEKFQNYSFLPNQEVSYVWEDGFVNITLLERIGDIAKIKISFNGEEVSDESKDYLDPFLIYFSPTIIPSPIGRAPTPDIFNPTSDISSKVDNGGGSSGGGSVGGSSNSLENYSVSSLISNESSSINWTSDTSVLNKSDERELGGVNMFLLVLISLCLITGGAIVYILLKRRNINS